VNVNVLTVSINTELILSLTDTTSGTSNFFKLQKKLTTKIANYHATVALLVLFVIMHMEISVLCYLLLPINQQLTLLHTMKLTKKSIIKFIMQEVNVLFRLGAKF